MFYNFENLPKARMFYTQSAAVSKSITRFQFRHHDAENKHSNISYHSSM